mmetsp:Transcript_10408/g.35952  ORF Transcript_10408/g.35952 Transcript_10408/m.35952 type:complete len:83 (-) Transcript_10408:225-473(-)
MHEDFPREILGVDRDGPAVHVDDLGASGKQLSGSLGGIICAKWPFNNGFCFLSVDGREETRQACEVDRVVQDGRHRAPGEDW